MQYVETINQNICDFGYNQVLRFFIKYANQRIDAHYMCTCVNLHSKLLKLIVEILSVILL